MAHRSRIGRGRRSQELRARVRQWRQKRFSEAGDTLIEVLVALTIIGLTAGALLGAFTTSIAASAQHRNIATLDAVLKSFVEEATYQLGDQQTTSPTFAACASTYSLPAPTGTPSNVTASISNVQLWQANNTWGTGCLASNPPQPQLLTATVTNTSNHVSESLQFVITDPVFSPANPAAPVWQGGTYQDVVAVPGNYTFAVQASGEPTPALSITSAYNWIQLVDNGGGNGTLVIDPTSTVTPGTYSVTLAATNSANGSVPVPHSFSVVVGTAPNITSSPTDTVPPGSAFTFTVTTTGSPFSALSASPLPAGVTFVDNGDGTGTLSGTNAVASQTYPITIVASNVLGSDQQNFSLTVSPPSAPVFSSGTSDSVPYDEPFTFTVSASGPPTPSLMESGALPSGVTFVDNGNGTGTLSGTPTDSTPNVPRTYTLTFTASNSVGPVTQSPSFTLTVNAQSSPTVSSPSASSPASLKKNKSGQSFTVTGTGFQNGATATSTGMTGVLVTFTNSTSITITGNTIDSSGKFSFTITNPDGGSVTVNNGLKLS